MRTSNDKRINVDLSWHRVVIDKRYGISRPHTAFMGL
jgi:hypothetical protein